MSIEYKPSPLNKYGLRCYNARGFQEYLSSIRHFSNAIVIPANAKIVHVVGQVPVDEHGEVPNDMKGQMRLVVKNTELALKAAGVGDGLNSVYSMTVYLMNGADELDEETMQGLGEVLRELLGSNRPCITAIMVQKILWPGARIEMQSQAVLE